MDNLVQFLLITVEPKTVVNVLHTNNGVVDEHAWVHLARGKSAFLCALLQFLIPESRFFSLTIWTFVD